MKTYEITLKPNSGFGTPLKGDTIFGHICWQAAYDPGLFGKSIGQLLSDYKTDPFLIVSSAFFKIETNGTTVRILKRPDVPLYKIFDLSGKTKKDLIKERKVLKGKRWMKIPHNQRIESLKIVEYVSDNELIEEIISDSEETKRIRLLVSEFTQPHNTINRLTNTTGEGRFAPFELDQNIFFPGILLIIYVGIREDIDIKQVQMALKRIGDMGFGRDASTGLGKFDVISAVETNLFEMGSTNSNACYTLSPSVPEKDIFSHTYFTPFTRFGRHGDILAKSSNPFKNPIIMADEGAVFVPVNMENTLKKPYIGVGVSELSKAQPVTVAQGYSLYIPVYVEV